MILCRSSFQRKEFMAGNIQANCGFGVGSCLSNGWVSPMCLFRTRAGTPEKSLTLSWRADRNHNFGSLDFLGWQVTFALKYRAGIENSARRVNLALHNRG